MDSPWKVTPPIETVKFAEIMSEEYAQRVQEQENKRFEIQKHDTKIIDTEGIWEDYSSILYDDTTNTDAIGAGSNVEAEEQLPHCLEISTDSDAQIAKMLQAQFDQEYNEELKRIENKRNKHSKVTVTLDKFRRGYDTQLNSDLDNLNTDNDDDRINRDWDRFETNEKEIEKIPKRGFRVDEEGEYVTKHDEHLCGVRNACRVMSFPIELSTGDGAGFDMKLPNNVYNQLKSFSHRGKGSTGRKNKMYDRKENLATVEMGLDQRTHLLLYKLVNNQILEHINGIISTGKEAVILHANSDANYKDTLESKADRISVLVPPELLPKECAIKIFKTTLNDFKQRDRYIKEDYRFKTRFSKQNNDVIINMWAEKEMQNLKRMQKVGINCPYAVVLKKNVLVMSFIGDNNRAAPKLKHVQLSDADLSLAYEEIIDAMFKLYNDAKLIHADLSEYNILWHDGKCWFIDVAQSVEPSHPSALEFLMRDCDNIVNFFTKRGLPNIYTKEQLFEHITSLNAENFNTALLERIHTRGASVQQATAPNMETCPDEIKPLEYPFDAAWEKSQLETKVTIDEAANAMKVISIKSDKNDHNIHLNSTDNTANIFLILAVSILHIHYTKSH